LPQGGPKSGDIHGGFTADIPEELRSCGAGVNIGNVEVTCLGFLDDYLTPSRKKETINEALETLRLYGQKWDVRWATEKFTVLSFNSTAEDYTWFYGDVEVSAATQHKYLGVVHSTKKPYWKAHFTEKRMVATLLLCALRSAGLIGGRNAPGQSLGIIQSMVWQTMDHGRATAHSEEVGHGQVRKQLEAFQVAALREILGLSKVAPKLAVFGETGDLPDRWRERRKQLLIGRQMLDSDRSSLPYRVAAEANSAIPKRGLFLRIQNIFESYEGKGRDISDFENKEEIKRWISRRASEEWQRDVAKSTRLFDTYRGSTGLRLRGYLKEDFKGRQILTKLRSDDLELGAASYRGIGSTKVDPCQTCKSNNATESRTHFVLHCPALEGARKIHNEIYEWITKYPPERAMAMVLLAHPYNASDDLTRARSVGAYLHELWTERALILGIRNNLR
jgi:hypothetical protein